MAIKQVPCEVFEIDGYSGLDPITVFLQDFGPGQGRMTIECYGSAWTTFWPAMGDKSVLQFVAGGDVDYIVNRLWSQHQKRTSMGEKYLTRIVSAVVTSFNTK